MWIFETSYSLKTTVPNQKLLQQVIITVESAYVIYFLEKLQPAGYYSLLETETRETASLALVISCKGH